MKKILGIVSAIALILTLASCSSADDKETTTPEIEENVSYVVDNGIALGEEFEKMSMDTSSANLSAAFKNANNAYTGASDEVKNSLITFNITTDVKMDLGVEDFDNSIVNSSASFGSMVDYDEDGKPTSKYVYYVVEAKEGSVDTVKAALETANTNGNLGQFFITGGEVTTEGNFVVLTNFTTTPSSDESNKSAIEVYATLAELTGQPIFESIQLLGKDVAKNLVNTSEPGGSSTTNIALDNFVSGVSAVPFRPLTTDKVVILELKDTTDVDAIKTGLTNMLTLGQICVQTDPQLVHVTTNGNYVGAFVSTMPYQIVKTGTAEGRNGELTVKLTMDGDYIANIEVEHEETPEYFEKVQNELVQNILMNQSTEGVDVVAGSTISSEAVIKAFNVALESEVGQLPENVVTLKNN